jgi:hypothetical protein
MNLGTLALSDDFGSNNIRYLARFDLESNTPQALFADYESASWKTGLLSQRTPQAAALRTLLWLQNE